MNDYIPSPEELEYLKSYDPGSWPRPSATADVLIFVGSPEKKLLLVRRRGFPYRGWWALPGGFCEPGESPELTAQRELKEETGVYGMELSLLGMFGEKDRDPRGWTVTGAYFGVTDSSPKARGADDAEDARWFSVRRELVCADGHCRTWRIALTSGEIELSAEVEENELSVRLPENGFRIVKRSGIAFDHAKFIAAALCRLENEGA